MPIYIGKQINAIEKPKAIPRKISSFSDIRPPVDLGLKEAKVEEVTAKVEEPVIPFDSPMVEQIMKNKKSDFLLDMFTSDE